MTKPTPDPAASHPPEMVAFATALRRALWRNLCVGAIAFLLGSAGLFVAALHRGAWGVDDAVETAVTAVVCVMGLAQAAWSIALDRRAQRGAPVLRLHLGALALLATLPVGIAALPLAVAVAFIVMAGLGSFVLPVLCLSVIPLLVAGTGLASAVRAWRLAPGPE